MTLSKYSIFYIIAISLTLFFTIECRASEYQDKQIKELSTYIKLRKSNQPKILCNDIAYQIITQSEATNMSVELIVGIVEVESMWNPYSISKAGAKGLMQVLIEDGIEIDPDRVYDIDYNISIGIAIFKSKLEKANGDLSLALKYYVGGDKSYYNSVYRYIGKYYLYKMNISNNTLSKQVKLSKVE